MTTTAGTMEQAERVRKTIWRLFERQHLSEDVATARLLLVDLALDRRAGQPERQEASNGQAVRAVRTARM